MRYTQNIIPAESVQMYQTHGDHIGAVMDTELFVKDFLHRILSESKLVKKVRAEVLLEEKEPYVTNAFSLLYREKNLGFVSLIATDKTQTINQFVTTYPVCPGVKIRVLIDTVWVWRNMMEATVRCSFRSFSFSFFAADYLVNKKMYVPGKVVDLEVGAWGVHVEEAPHGFSFEGQQAIDWQVKTGEETGLDEMGNVSPVRFSTEQLVAFLPVNEKCPDEPEFQSPAGTISKRNMLGVEFWETEVFINRDDFPVRIPLLFQTDMVPEAKPGMPLRGHMWIVGRIS